MTTTLVTYIRRMESVARHLYEQQATADDPPWVMLAPRARHSWIAQAKRMHAESTNDRRND